MTTCIVMQLGAIPVTRRHAMSW